MFKEIKQFISDFYEFRKEIKLLLKKKDEPLDYTKLQVELMRRVLGSMDLSDYKEPKEIKSRDRKRLLASIASSFPYIETIIKEMIYDQTQFLSRYADNLSFPRGTVNGMDLILDKLKDYKDEFVESTKPKPDVQEKGIGIPTLSVSPFPHDTIGEEERST